MGRGDVVKHCSTKSYLNQAKAQCTQSRINLPTASSMTVNATKRLEAEVEFAVLTAYYNIPLAFHDHLSPMIQSVFNDSEIASNYHAASTKSTCILNLAVAPCLQEDLIASMKLNAFAIAVDGSNDTGLNKMNPVTVRIFDEHTGKIVTRFLDMCATSGSTAAAIFETIHDRLTQLLGISNPWDLCTSVGVDNTSVNIGVRNSIKTRVLQHNSAIYSSGCPCHILHNAGQKAAEAFNKESGFDVEEFLIDIYYWFDKSTKRKNTLQEYCKFCDHDYRSIIKHVSTRWLTLKRLLNEHLNSTMV